VVEALNALAPHTCPQLLEICEKAGKKTNQKQTKKNKALEQLDHKPKLH
jgi:hypothetical protein